MLLSIVGGARGAVPTFVATPSGEGRWPGVVVVHDAWDRLADACPIVASYGADDPTLKGAAARLERTLVRHGIPHDVKEYPGVGHGFMNSHNPEDSTWVFGLLSRLSNTRYDPQATADARRRIADFFEVHLKS